MFHSLPTALATRLKRFQRRLAHSARRPLSLLLTVAIIIVSVALVGSPTHADAPDRPNIVLIMADDMGFSDIGCYGGEIDTPNLDALAARGMRFRNFYNNAKCEMTRASLLTGRWWHHVGASPTVHYSAPTYGERMRDAGYRTLMVGKWHAGQTPYQRGFDRHYGLTDGCCNYWNPGHAREGEPEPAKKRVRRWAIDEKEFYPYQPPTDDFYTTDAFTDYAVKYLDEYKDEDKPFLLYVAYTAPHYPLHASEEDIAKYRGRYGEIGWDELRRRRFARQLELGVLPPGTQLSPRDPNAPAWEDVPESERDLWDLRMATYAAMIDRMDRGIGRILEQIEQNGDTQNTMVFFLSDNGATDDSADRSTVAGAMPWEVTSFQTQGRGWANASNTPYRKYKTTNYEGGTRTPMIAAWPGVTEPGAITDRVGHLIDFMPTMLAAAGVTPDKELPGKPLQDALNGTSQERPWPMFWQFNRAKAIRDHQWKLVRFGQSNWELYDLDADPTECHDLTSDHPEKVQELTRQWETWWESKEER